MGTHRAHADLLRDVLRLVDVDLVERDLLAELLGELLEDGRDDLARAAPGRPEVNDDRLVAVDLYIARRSVLRRRIMHVRGVNAPRS